MKFCQRRMYLLKTDIFCTKRCLATVSNNSATTPFFLLVITNGRQEVHARTLTSACKSGIRTGLNMMDINVFYSTFTNVVFIFVTFFKRFLTFFILYWTFFTSMFLKTGNAEVVAVMASSAVDAASNSTSESSAYRKTGLQLRCIAHNFPDDDANAEASTRALLEPELVVRDLKSTTGLSTLVLLC